MRGAHVTTALRDRRHVRGLPWVDPRYGTPLAPPQVTLATCLKYVAFDLETVELLPDRDEEDAPLPGIACIGYAYYNVAGTHGCRLLLNAHAITPDGTIPAGIPPGVGSRKGEVAAAAAAAAAATAATPLAAPRKRRRGRGTPGPALSVAQVREFVELLWSRFHTRECCLVTWSGTSSDFRLLYHAVGDSPRHRRMIVTMCMHHVDVPLLTICTHGRVMGLAQVAEALHLPQKPAKSIEVPMLWRDQGTRPLVVQHVKHDAQVTLQLAISIALKRSVPWVTLSGDEAMVPVYATQCRYTGAMCIPSVQQALHTPCIPLHYKLCAPHTREACAGWLHAAASDAGLLQPSQESLEEHAADHPPHPKPAATATMDGAPWPVVPRCPVDPDEAHRPLATAAVAPA